MDKPKYLSNIQYEWSKKDFFLTHGPPILEQYSKIFQNLYPEKYVSSSPIDNDFSAPNLFTYIENELAENLQIDYKVHLDNDYIDYRLKFFSREKQLRMLAEKDYFDSIYYFNFHKTAIPIQIRELLNDNVDILNEYYKSCIISNLKQFYLRGHINTFWLNTDYLYKYGFNKFLSQFNRFKVILIKDLDDRLNNYTETGSYGMLRKANLYSKYKNLSGEEIRVQLLKFQFENNSINPMPVEGPIIKNFLIHDLKLNPMEYLINKSYLDEYALASYDPINRVRELLNLPKVGEGWISETKLYYQIKNHFKNHTVLQHIKPKWLGKQHFDIYFPILNIALEYQGKQHYESVDYFGGEESFKKNVERDNRKRKLALENDCNLHYVESGYNLDEIILNIKKSKNYKEL